MKQFFKTATITFALGLFSVSALAECDMPAAPIIPDGNVASQDELVAAQKSIKIMQASMIEYRECLIEEEGKIDAESETAEEQKLALTNSYNDSVAAETKVAEEFNTAVKAFKSRQ